MGLLEHFRESLRDPVLRILVTATLISRVGRGVFVSMSVLYITLVLGLSAGQAATVLGVSSAVGIGTSYLGGLLADRFSARRLLFWTLIAEGMALACYPFAGSFSTILVIACVSAGCSSASNSTRMAIVARAFGGAERVKTRAVLRTVTNVAIAGGAGLAAVALLIGTPTAYRGVLLGAAALYLLGTLPVWRLPQRVDARGPAKPVKAVDLEGAAPVKNPKDSPFRDGRYLFLTGLSAVFGMQFGLAEVGVPLWVVNNTQAPTVMVSVMLIANTVIVIAFQIPLSRGTDDPLKAGNVVVLAGIAIVAACVLYPLSGGVGAAMAILLLLLAATAHAFAEVWSMAGTWGLSFELAGTRKPGAYQGVFAMGAGLGSMCAPFVVAGTALKFGLLGWLGLALVFLIAALGISFIARRASRSKPDYLLPAGRVEV